jgi:cation transport protein ChaC
MSAPPSDASPPDSPLAALPSTDDAHVLSRVFLEAGGIGALVARDAPTQRLLSDAERHESLLATLALRPPGDAWLFGYGSLIWNPTVHSVERRVAHIQGWHRAFCLSVQAGRGSAEQPGLVLGLDAGGSCTGVAYRIEESLLRSELELLWRREMVSGADIPRWLDIHDEQGQRYGSAIAFTMDPGCAQYAGHLCDDEVVQRLATARGALGSSADYLFKTCESLRACGLVDAEMERLARDVMARQRRA